MIYLTGDTHGDFRRFSTRRFPQQKHLGRDDFVLILGDFGGVFDGSPSELYWLDWLNDKPFTTLFLDGNHENFDVLDDLPCQDWHRGKVQYVRPHILHLCRGHVFRLDGQRLFVLGGGQSHDAKVLLPQGPGLGRDRRALRRRGTPFRVQGESWWPQELPGPFELRQALDALAWEDWETDFVLTHCAPTDLQARLFPGYPANALTDFLSSIRRRLTCRQWFCGHYHQSLHLADERFRVLYEEIVPLHSELERRSF